MKSLNVMRIIKYAHGADEVNRTMTANQMLNLEEILNK
jgi:hypothetical protein